MQKKTIGMLAMEGQGPSLFAFLFLFFVYLHAICVLVLLVPFLPVRLNSTLQGVRSV